jgi:hypothetical protein
VAIFVYFGIGFFEEASCFGFVGGFAFFESSAEDVCFVEEDFAVDCP